ncbi:MAG: outer membrane beta-barrel protein, partial [Gammaproteobacteria bacterium]
MIRKLVLGTGLALLATSAFAQSTATPYNQLPPDNRFFISIMASAPFTFDGSHYQVPGFTFGIGKPITDYFGLELFGQQYHVTSDSTALHPSFGVTQRDYGLNALVFMHRGNVWNPYIEIGGGRMHSAWTGPGGPNGIDRTDNNWLADAGIGTFVRVANYLDIRADLRFNQMITGITDEGIRLNNPVASIGIAIPLGPPPRAAPPPAPPAPPPPPPQPQPQTQIVQLPNVHFAFD